MELTESGGTRTPTAAHGKSVAMAFFALLAPWLAAAGDAWLGGIAMAAETDAVRAYDPAIKRRIVFTDWRFIDPGWFSWVDAQGQGRGLGESWGPDDLFFRPTSSPYGIRLVALPAETVGPLIEPDRPWEKTGVWLVTIIYENGVYRAWALTWAEWAKPPYLTYFESPDGYTWQRPRVGLHDYEGNQDNNILLADLPGNKAVFVDPAGPAEERYKMVLGDLPGGVRGAVSPDGLRWTLLPEPILKGQCDTQNIGYYDEQLRKYVVYRRLWDGGRRAVGRSESTDFRSFPPSEVIVEGIHPGLPPSVDVYTNCRTTIPLAPDHHLLFPTVYLRERDLGVVYMAASRDGRLWHFLPGSPVVVPGTPGQWDAGWKGASPNLIELPNGDFALPLYAQPTPHKYPRGQLSIRTGYALWPKGRIAALEAPELGEFTTLALAVGGRKMRINAVTQRAGSVLVEVADVPGRSFADCDPIVGDQFRKIVTWKGQEDLGYEADKPIVLRFRLDKAKLFGLDFE